MRKRRASRYFSAWAASLAGVTDVITKSLGTNNAMNIVKATAEGLKNMQNPEEVAERRGVTVDYIWGRKPQAASVEEAE